MNYCTVRHAFDIKPCGKPAIFQVAGTDARVCRECRRFLTHMPSALFVPLTARRAS